MSNREELTGCGICSHVYDDVTRVPKFLRCFHSYCTVCLDKIHSLSGKFECPVCRTVTPGSDAMGLTTNFYITQFMEVLRDGSGSSASSPHGAVGGPSCVMRPRIPRRTQNVRLPATPSPTKSARPPSPEHITDPYLRKFCTPAKRSRLDRDVKCHLCLEYIASSCSRCGENSPCPVVQLTNCFDAFHQHCLGRHFGGDQPDFFECPLCQTLQGIKMGNQPTNGQMNVTRDRNPLPGFSGCGRITINFTFPGGYQDNEGPHPGAPYDVSAFPKTCYLPDNEEGTGILRLLEEAFRRRLLFQIETIRGLDRVTFGGVTLKVHDYPSRDGFGYPDDKYLNLVQMELNTLGVLN